MENNSLKKNYFEPRDEEEEYILRIDSKLNEKYETLESLYNRVFTPESLEEAKNISVGDREKKKNTDKSLTYGEVTFRSMAYIFEFCKNIFDIDEYSNFIDFGSGAGCAVLSSVLCFNFRKYIGIEYIKPLNEKAEQNRIAFMKIFPEIKKKYKDFLPHYIYDEELNNIQTVEYTINEENKDENKVDKDKDICIENNKENEENKENENKKEIKEIRKINIPHIEFHNGNFLDFDVKEASFIFMNSTCFSNELLGDISIKLQKEVPIGCIVITFTKKLPDLNLKKWEIKRGFKRLMSWGAATVFIHRRKS